MSGLYQLQPDLDFRLATVNGQAGLVAKDAGGHTLAVASLAIAHGLIERIWATCNSDKLAHWA